MFVLSRALPAASSEFAALLVELRSDHRRRLALASLNDLLTGLSAAELTAAVADADLSGSSSFVQNHVAAMVEHAAEDKGVAPPEWTATVDPLDVRSRGGAPTSTWSPRLDSGQNPSRILPARSTGPRLLDCGPNEL